MSRPTLLPSEPTFTRVPGSPLTWRDKTVIRILLIVARMLANDSNVLRELERLASHIAVARDEETTP